MPGHDGRLEARATMSGEKRFPTSGFIGVTLCAAAWAAAWTRARMLESVQIHTFFPLWFGYILTVNALVKARTGRTPAEKFGCRYHLLFPFSAGFWWLFELLNRVTNNWIYLGVDSLGPVEYFAFASISFSTVLPAVLGTKLLLESYAVLDATLQRGPALRPRPYSRMAALCVGTGTLMLLPTFPEELFPFLWVSPLLILLALERRPIVADVVDGDWRETGRWALAALLCGAFWEMWNYYSLAKWIYHVPYVDFLRIFEMPLLGYGGYLPFGVLCGAVCMRIVKVRE